MQLLKPSSARGEDARLPRLLQEVGASLWARIFLGDGPSSHGAGVPFQPSCHCSGSRPGLGRRARISCHFLRSARALIENLGGLAYLFSWNVVGYIFTAFSQQCRVSISNYDNEKKSQSPSARRHTTKDRPLVWIAVWPLQILTKWKRSEMPVFSWN